MSKDALLKFGFPILRKCSLVAINFFFLHKIFKNLFKFENNFLPYL